MALLREQSSIHKELDPVLDYDLVYHDDSGLDNQNPTLQEQITALAKAGHNADLLQLQDLNKDVQEIKISLADTMDLIQKALQALSDAGPITSVDDGDVQYVRRTHPFYLTTTEPVTRQPPRAPHLGYH